MTSPPKQLVCQHCNLATALPEDHFSVKCANEGCKKLLVQAKHGTKFIQTKCQDTHIHRVSEDTTTIYCPCCKETPVLFAVDLVVSYLANGHKVYKTEKVTGFVQRRFDELKQIKEQLKEVKTKLGKSGIPMPVLRQKDVTERRRYNLPWSTLKTKCDGCGKDGKIEPFWLAVRCGYKDCPVSLFRPLQPYGAKYLRLKCNKKLATRIVHEKDIFVSCECCNQEFAIDTVASNCVNDQTFFETVPSSPFIKNLCQQIYDAKNQLEAVENALNPSLWRRMFQKSKEVAMKVTKQNRLVEIGEIAVEK